MSMPPPPSRSTSCFVAKQARGFQLLRIDGYSCTKDLPGGERITSSVFTVGGRNWCVDYYPNGADASVSDSDAAALYLRLVGTAARHLVVNNKERVRVRARYKFSLLDLAGTAAFERPEETGLFTFAGPTRAYGAAAAAGQVAAAGGSGDVGCGYAAFITRGELEGLVREDRLAIRCDVSVTEVAPAPAPLSALAANPSPAARILSDDDDDNLVAPRRRRFRTNYNIPGAEFYGMDGSLEPPPDDKEYIRRCLAAKRPRQ